MTGLFGDSHEFAASLAKADRQQRTIDTPEDRLAREAELNRVLASGVHALTEEQRKADETEIDAMLCGSLEKLYDDFMRESTRKTPRTVQLYTSTFKTFHEFCRDGGATSLPAKIGIVASYLHEQVLAGASESKIQRIISAISYAHTIKDEFDPTDNELVRAVKHAAKVKGGKANGHS
jgi:hypothetical protein